MIRNKLIPVELLYDYGSPTNKNRVYQHYNECTLSCTDSNRQVKLNFLEATSYHKLCDQQYEFIHIGLIALSIKGLTRKYLGAKVFVAIIDDSHLNLRQATIATMEIDMNHNIGLIYLLPDSMMTIDDFYKYFKLVIKTKGYDMCQDRQNLLITKHLISRINNSSLHSYKLKIRNVLQHLESTGIQALEAHMYDATNLLAKEWNFTLPNDNQLVPTRVNTYLENNSSLTIKFSDYTTRNINLNDFEENE